MKKAIFIVGLFLLISCDVTRNLPKQLYDCKLELQDSSSNKKEPMTYEDSIMVISFAASRNSINFGLKNKSTQPIIIDWDACSFIQNGKNMRVMHNGINFVHRNEPMAKTALAPQTILNDFIVPSDNVYYYTGFITGFYNVTPGWFFYDMFKVSEKDALTPEIAYAQKGQKVSFMLSMEIDSKKISRVFNFIVRDVNAINQ